MRLGSWHAHLPLPLALPPPRLNLTRSAHPNRTFFGGGLVVDVYASPVNASPSFPVIYTPESLPRSGVLESSVIAGGDGCASVFIGGRECLF